MSATISQEQDQFLIDQLGEYRHLMTNPDIPDARKQRASDAIKEVYGKLAKLNDSRGLISHVNEYVRAEFIRRHHANEHPDIEPRKQPLCNCGLSREVCEVQRGEVPSAIHTVDLKYLSSEDPQDAIREYLQNHPGDVVVSEAVADYRDLRSEIYATLSQIIQMLLGGSDSGRSQAREGASANPDDERHNKKRDAVDAAREQSERARAVADGGSDSEGGK